MNEKIFLLACSLFNILSTVMHMQLKLIWKLAKRVSKECSAGGPIAVGKRLTNPAWERWEGRFGIFAHRPAPTLLRH